MTDNKTWKELREDAELMDDGTLGMNVKELIEDRAYEQDNFTDLVKNILHGNSESRSLSDKQRTVLEGHYATHFLKVVVA